MEYAYKWLDRRYFLMRIAAHNQNPFSKVEGVY